MGFFNRSSPGKKTPKESEHRSFGDDDAVDKGDASLKKKKKKLKKHSPAGPEKDARTVFVGNLPATYTAKVAAPNVIQILIYCNAYSDMFWAGTEPTVFAVASV